MSVGVVIGRFQVPELSPGHKYLLEYVVARHDRVVVLIGSATTQSHRNPLSYEIRSNMIVEYLESMESISVESGTGFVAGLPDQSNDTAWSKHIDEFLEEIFPDEKIILYGSRDSFIPHYFGKHLTEEIKEVESLSGTELREAFKANPVNTPDFRAGVIYGQAHRIPTSFQAVDIAVIKQGMMNDNHDHDPDQVLLGRKHSDPEGKWRFIGGFVDPEDESLEDAARRELREETGGDLEVSRMDYVGSCRSGDWRFRDSHDKLMSAMYVTYYMHGRARPSDDINEVKWFEVHTLTENEMVKDHVPLLNMLKEWLDVD